MVARGWSKAQKQAYILADNKLALNAGWDAELLRIEMSELLDLGCNLAFSGFSELEIAAATGDPVQEHDEAAEWQDMPEYEQENLYSAARVNVHFRSIDDKIAFGRLIDQALTEKTRAVWYPRRGDDEEKLNPSNKRYASVE